MQQPDRRAPGGRAGSWDFGIETTLIRILGANAQAFPQRVAMREKDRGIWQQTSWQQVLDSVLGCAAGLQSLGLGQGEALLVLGDNRPHLYMGMLSAGALGCYAMPVYPDATPDEILHVVQDVQVRFVLAEDQEQVDKALDLRDRGAPIERIGERIGLRQRFQTTIVRTRALHHIRALHSRHRGAHHRISECNVVLAQGTFVLASAEKEDARLTRIRERKRHSDH